MYSGDRPPNPVGRSNNLYLTASVLSIFGALGAYPAQPPFGISEPAAYLLAAALLFLAALFSVLRGLFEAAAHGMPLDAVSEADRRRIEPMLSSLPSPMWTAGLARFVFASGAVLLFAIAASERTGISLLGLWTGAFVLAGLLLEGLPSLAMQGRFVGTACKLLPLLSALRLPFAPFHTLMRWLHFATGAPYDHSEHRKVAAGLMRAMHEADREEKLEEDERRMIEHIMELPETDAAAIMTPRTKISAIPVNSTVQEAAAFAAEQGHSRLPVYEEDYDHIVGVFYIKDLLDPLGRGEPIDALELRGLLREPVFVPESKPIDDLLNELRVQRIHLAVVVDEYGGTAGIVTIEDILEEIVGEIDDEHDADIEQRVVETGQGELYADAAINIAELNERIGSRLPEEEEFDTLGGLILERLGEVPSAGVSFREDGVLLTILEADERRIHKVQVELSPDPSGLRG